MEQHRESHDISAEQGLVIDMTSPFTLDLQGYSGAALIVSHDTLRRHARNLLGEKADHINFKLNKSVDLTTPAGRALKHAVVYAMNEMNGALGLLNNPLSITNLENYLLTQFITLHPNSFMEASEAGSNPVIMPGKLKRARDYIHAHAHENITLEALATYAGCSYRSLQNSFGKVLGISPMEYLKIVRLEGIHKDLLNADSPQKTVAEIANQWGFVHMGRLANMYKKQFGVLPSNTLSQKK
jgi:AraC-like DNA-binding protein